MAGGRHPDGVETYPATVDDLATYERARQQLSEFSAPELLDRESPSERMFLAAFDGTGNSMSRDEPENYTNVAQIYVQVRGLREQGIDNIAGGYVEGSGTQDGFILVGLGQTVHERCARRPVFEQDMAIR